MLQAAGRDVPGRLVAWLLPFRATFTARTWQHVLVLVMGAILVPGATHRRLGIARHRAQPTAAIHQLSPRAEPQQMVRPLALPHPVRVARQRLLPRRGADRDRRGRYDRATMGRADQTTGHLSRPRSFVAWPLRQGERIALALPHAAARDPWAGRCWALPFLTVLAPSQRYWETHKAGQREHKKLTDWARQMLLQAARWLPDRRIIGVGDASFAAIELLNDVRTSVTMITRLRLDAVLHKPPPPRRPGKVGRRPVVGKRLPSLKQRLANPKTRWRRLLVSGWYGHGERLLEVVSDTALWHHPGRRVPIRYVLVRDPLGKLEPQAFLCTDLDAEPLDILRWFVRRWSIEVTFAEVRRHLGVETQRQWSELAIERTTPILFGLFSLITLWASEHFATHAPAVRFASWYRKSLPTFSDILAHVRRQLWADSNSETSRRAREPTQIHSATRDILIDIACYAA